MLTQARLSWELASMEDPSSSQTLVAINQAASFRVLEMLALVLMLKGF